MSESMFCQVQAAPLPAGELLDGHTCTVTEVDQVEGLLDRAGRGQRFGPDPPRLGDSQVARKAPLLQHDPDPGPHQASSAVRIVPQHPHHA